LVIVNILNYYEKVFLQLNVEGSILIMKQILLLDLTMMMRKIQSVTGPGWQVLGSMTKAISGIISVVQLW
jgi:hypothetical protein